MKTTLNAIREHKPCSDDWKKLLECLCKTQADDEPLAITTVLDSNGLYHALWCLRAVQPHPTAQTLRILPRYRAAPWHWASLTPDVELPSAVVQVEGLEPVTYPGYNRIYLSGTGDGGVLADATVYYVRIEAA